MSTAVIVGATVGGAAGLALLGLVVWRCIFVSRQDRPLGDLTLVNAAEVEEYVTGHKEEWLAADEKLFLDAPTWRLRKNAPVNADGINLTVRERADPTGNANNLFWYYAETSIPISPRVAMKLFGSWIPLSRAWTKEVRTTQQLLVCADGSEVWAQYMMPSFLPRFFGVMPRLLVACYVTAERANGDGCVSARSLPPQLYDASAAPRRTPIIDWYGAFRFLAVPGDDAACSVCKLDREDQGGLFPAWLMNLTMPKFLTEEVLKATAFIRDNAPQLVGDFEGDGDKLLRFWDTPVEKS